MDIFTIIESYIEKNISAIPIHHKIPLIKNWSIYSKQIPRLDELQGWEKTTNPNGIGIIMGPVSNICCIDVDTTDKEVLKLIQYSPVEKVGAKGLTRFYRLRDLDDPSATYPTGIISLKDEYGKVAVEFFFSDKMVAIPPGEHPDGMRYRWTTPQALIDIDFDALPVFLTENINAVKNYLGKANIVNLPKEVSDDGGHRFIDMGSYASELIRKGTGLDDAVNLLLERDAERNKFNPFFLDPGKGFKSLSVKVNASLYYTSVMETFASKKSNLGDIEEPKSLNPVLYSKDWGLPIPLRNPLPPMNTNLIPDKWREWCLINAENTGVSPYPIFLQALVGLSSLLGNKVTIKPKKHDEYTQYPNIWACIIAPPGSKKTQVSDIALYPLHQVVKIIEQKKRENKKAKAQEIAKMENEREELESRIKRIRRQEPDKISEIVEMKERLGEIKQFLGEVDAGYTAIIQSATPEKLMRIAQDNVCGGLVFHNEGSELYNQFKKKGYEMLRPFLVKAWDGMSFGHQTKGQGDIYIENLCLSLATSIQPTVFKRNVLKTLDYDDDGFIQRNLIYFDQSGEREVVDRPLVGSLRDDIAKIFIQAYNQQAHNSKLCNGAYGAYMAYLSVIEKKVVSEENPTLGSFWGKYRGLVVRIAYLLDFISGDSVVNEISEEALSGAMDILEFNTKNVNVAFRDQTYDDAQVIVDAIKNKLITNGITIRELCRLGILPVKYTGAAKMEKILGLLMSHNYVSIERERQAVKVFFNPNLG
jgi:hypothetical protein